MADDDDDFGFPEDWGEPLDSDVGAAAATEVVVDKVKEAALSELAEADMELEERERDEDEELVEEEVEEEVETAFAGFQEIMVAENVVEDDAVEDDDDDELAALESAAIAAFVDMHEGAEGNPVIDEQPLVPASLAKTPGVKGSETPKGAKGAFGGKGKCPAGKVGGESAAPVHSTTGKGLAGKAGKGLAGKAGSNGFAASGKASKGKGAGLKGKGPGKTFIGKGSVGAMGKAAGKGSAPQAGAPPRPDGGVGKRVLALNKAGHWGAGRGITLTVLQKLQELPLRDAGKIIVDLEAQAKSVLNPSKWIMQRVGGQSASGTAGASPPWRTGAAGAGAGAGPTPAGARGLKRAVPVCATVGTPSKRPALEEGSDWEEEPALDGSDWEEEGDDAVASTPQRQAKTAAAMEEALLQQLDPAVRTKVQEMPNQDLGPAALRALAGAQAKDALVLLLALASREKAGKRVADPTKFIVGGLAAAPKPAAPKLGIAKAPISKAPVAKTPVPKTPVAKAPIAKAPITTSRS